MVNERARFMRVANIRCERVCFLLEACETGFGVCLMPAFQERGHTYMAVSYTHLTLPTNREV